MTNKNTLTLVRRMAKQMGLKITPWTGGTLYTVSNIKSHDKTDRMTLEEIGVYLAKAHAYAVKHIGRK